MNPLLKRLPAFVETFYRDVESAKTIDSPNQEDDLAIKVAIVGFSHHSPTESWNRAHYDYVLPKLKADYSDSELASYGENGMNVRLFCCLGMGYLLGLYEQGLLAKYELDLGEAILPGVIMQHLPAITARPC